MTPDDQLSAFLGEQPATSRADLFTAVVMQKIERRAFLRDVAAAGGWPPFSALRKFHGERRLQTGA